MADDDISFLPADLAPGDARSLSLDRAGFTVARICSSEDPPFTTAYERLWAEFGAQHEMESREVIERRLAWHPARAAGDCWLRYEILLVQHGGHFAAVRDHTAVAAVWNGSPYAVVHLSHVLVEAGWRRSGLAGWLRAWPIQTARACLGAAGFPSGSPITLLAEMEHPEPAFPGRLVRLQAYEKAGFLKADPAAAKYFQPDFRAPAEIDASGGPRPLPFGLVMRRVGRERQQVIRGAELREMVSGLYRMYATGFRPADMAAVWKTLRDYPVDEAEVALVPPTQ